MIQLLKLYEKWKCFHLERNVIFIRKSERRYIMKKGIQLIIAGLLVLPLAGCSKEKMELANKEVTVEYGQTISADVKDYLKNDSDFLKDVKIEGIPDNEEQKQYPGVGEYDLSLKYEDTVEKVKVIVKDTVAPEFKDIKDKYEVALGSKLNTKDIKAEDLSAVIVTLDDKEVNYKKAGDYKTVIIAKDVSGNETKKEISIVVKEEEKKENSSSSTSSSSKKSNTSGGSSSSNSKSSSSSSNNNKSSSSSGSTSKSGGSGSTSSDKKTNGSNSSSNSSVSSNITGYTCLEGNCGKHFSTWSAFQKHRKEAGHEHANYGTDHSEFNWPDDWN